MKHHGGRMDISGANKDQMYAFGLQIIFKCISIAIRPKVANDQMESESILPGFAKRIQESSFYRFI